MSVQGRELLCEVLWMWGPACWPCAERASGQRSAPACRVCLHARHLYATQTSLLSVGCGRRECGVPGTDWLDAPCMLWLYVRLTARPRACVLDDELDSQASRTQSHSLPSYPCGA